MSNRVFLLLKTQYLNTNLLNRIRHEEDRKHRNRDIGMCVAYGILIMMLLIYSFGMALIGILLLGVLLIILGTIPQVRYIKKLNLIQEIERNTY